MSNMVPQVSRPWPVEISADKRCWLRHVWNCALTTTPFPQEELPVLEAFININNRLKLLKKVSVSVIPFDDTGDADLSLSGQHQVHSRSRCHVHLLAGRQAR
jgi:hypothetical protein